MKTLKGPIVVYDFDEDNVGCLRLHVNTDEAPTAEEADRIRKMIAAAPDLLSACEAVVSAWDQMDSRSLGEVIAEARAAIAKAQGGGA